jgi:primosomal replication protein N
LPTEHAAANQVVLAGSVGKRPDTRNSPAGIPISRFVVEHVSEQMEAGHPRRVTLRIAVKAVGAGLQGAVKGLQEGDQVRVSGFLNRADYRQGEHRLVLHAQQIELMK